MGRILGLVWYTVMIHCDDTLWWYTVMMHYYDTLLWYTVTIHYVTHCDDTVMIHCDDALWWCTVATNEDTFQKDARTIFTLCMLLSACWNKPAEAMLPLGVPLLPVVIMVVDIVILHPSPSCVNTTFLSSTVQTALGHTLSSGMVVSLFLALNLVVVIPLVISECFLNPLHNVVVLNVLYYFPTWCTSLPLLVFHVRL
jgi:hypothetical protein